MEIEGTDPRKLAKSMEEILKDGKTHSFNCGTHNGIKITAHVTLITPWFLTEWRKPWYKVRGESSRYWKPNPQDESSWNNRVVCSRPLNTIDEVLEAIRTMSEDIVQRCEKSDKYDEDVKQRKLLVTNGLQVMVKEQFPPSAAAAGEGQQS